MEQQQQAAAESSPSLAVVDVKEQTQAEPEPQLDAASASSPANDKDKNKKKKKKKKKNRRKSLEKSQSEVEDLQDNNQEEEELQDDQDDQDDQDNQKEEEDKEPSIQETTVTTETSSKQETVETEAVASEDGLELPSLERQSSLDTLKATGTKAVGSLFSRFKVGRGKKPLPSRTESAAKLELVNPSPVKTAVKKLEVPEEKNLDDLPMRTKRDFFGSGEQSVHVSAEKEKYDTLEKQRKDEKEKEDAAIAARHTPPSSTRSNEELQSAFAAADEETSEVATKSTVESQEVESQELVENANDKPEVEVKSEVTSDVVIEESTKGEEAAPSPVAVDEVEPAVSVGEALTEDVSVTLEVTEIADKQVATTDVVTEEVSVTLETTASVDEQVAATEVATEDVSVALQASEHGDGQVISADAGNNNATVSESTDEMPESDQHSADTSTVEPVSLKLDLDPELNLNNDTTEASLNEVEEVAGENSEFPINEAAVEPTVTESVEVVASIEKKQSDTTLTMETELLSVKITPPISEAPAEATPPAKPEKMSPVKSLASRFEGKHEQSLDNLKFRTVREFFTEERTIRVGAEKQKYEAQAQQQKMKAKAEEEAKSKYNTGHGFKSPGKENAAAASSTTFKATSPVVQEATVVDVAAAAADPVDFSTPDSAASRKKFSFDDGHAAANSPSKFSDEALTPVKSIASRFEGKREQSLDSLKFRTVREFFPEERSVRVGSEKEKFEAKAQQDKSLDNLKFRTVREFFPDEGKRSIHVGAEKEKFEAITKQQEEDAKAAEQIKVKHTALSPTPVTTKVDSADVSVDVGATNEVPVSTLDESAVKKDVPEREPKAEDAVDTIAESVSVDTETPIESTVPVEVVITEKDETSSSPLTVTENIAVSVEDASAATDGYNQVEDSKNASVVEVEPVSAGTEDVVSDEVKDVNTQKAEVSMGEEEAEKVEVSMDNGHVELDLEASVTANGVTPTCAGAAAESAANANISRDIEDTEASQEQFEEVKPKIDTGVVDLDLGEPAAKDLAESSSAASRDDAAVSSEQAVAPEKIQDSVEVATGELVELEIGEPTVENRVKSSSGEGAVLSEADVPVPAETREAVKESHPEVKDNAVSTENGLVELDLGEPIAEVPKVQPNQGLKPKTRPMLTTERSFVIEDDHTIEAEDTVVVGERPMTDDEFEPLSSSSARAAHEEFAGITTPKAKKELKKKTSTPKLTRKVSIGSAGSAKSPPPKTTVPVPMKRASITAPTASYMAKKAAEAEQLQKASPKLKKQGSASKLKGTVSETGFVKPPPAAPTVPVPMKRASITAPTASYMARKAAEAEDLQKASQQLKKQGSASKLKGTVGPTGFVKPIPPPPTVPVAPKRASIMAPTASYRAKKAAEHAEDIDVPTNPTPPRNKRYSNIKSKVFEGIQSGSMHATPHKTITKEEFIAAERRKSLGSAGVRSVLDAVDRRASLTGRAAINGPPEPFVRSAFSRKKLNSTVPRYMDYENTPGYADRARKQYERRKRLEEENAAKSEKRQQELRVFFSERQQKAMISSADEVRRGLEAHEFTKAAKESEIAAQKALRKETQRASTTRSSYRRPSSAASSADASSSTGVTSRTSKKSSVSSVEKVEVVAAVESTVAEIEEIAEKTAVVTEEIADETAEFAQEEVVTEVQEVVVEATQVEEQTIPVPVVDEDPALEHVAKKIDFDEASSDSDEKDVSNE